MEVYFSARFLDDAWITKRRMDYGRAPWLGASAFTL